MIFVVSTNSGSSSTMSTRFATGSSFRMFQEPHRHRGSQAELAVHRDCPPVVVDDPLHEREPQAHSFRLGLGPGPAAAEEDVKDLGQLLFRNTDPGVSHAEEKRVAVLSRFNLYV